MAELRSPHPSDELLVAYLTTGLSGGEGHGIDRHLQGCDLCVENLATMQRRLSISPEVCAPVPPDVQERVAALSAIDASSPAVPSPTSEPDAAFTRPPIPRPAWLFSALDRVASVLRPRVLVPVAAAATVLVVVATQSDWMNPVPERERSRSVEIREVLRVTASEASVWQEPGVRREAPREEKVIALLKRGAPVEIVGEKDQWYRVLLPDGRAGWMERNAFE